jgi:hypothetical protein
MAEVIKNYKEAICTIPKQSLLAADIYNLRQSLSRKRKEGAKDEVKKQIAIKERELADYLLSIGRSPTDYGLQE